MPCLVAVAHHGAGGAYHVPDEAAVDEPPGGLDTGPQEGVRGAAQAQVFLLGQGDELRGLLHVHGQGLFGIGVLAVEQGLLGDLIVLVGAGQVQDDLHLRVVKGLVHVLIDFGLPHIRPGGNLLLDVLDALLGPLWNQVADAHQVQLPEGVGDVLQVYAADGAYADHGDSHIFHGSNSSFASISA